MSLAYSDAPFYWPLRGSIALQNGSGTPTFTRATAKWMFNDEGKLIKLPSGAIEMRGYRPVINYFSYSEDLVNAAWTKTGTSATAAAYVIEDSGLSNHGIQRTVTTPIAINDFVAVKLKVRSDRRYVLLRLNDSASNANAASIVFDLQNGSVVTSATVYGSFMTASGSISAIGSNGYYTISLSVKTSVASVNFKAHHSASSTLTGDGQLSTFTGDGLSRLYCTELQFEITTGANDKISSNEYVSANVLSSPWHGAGANGVKFFATTKSGVAIPESSLIGAWLNPNQTINTLLWCRDFLAGANAGKWIPSTTGSEIVINGTPGVDTSSWNAFDATLSIVSGKLQVQSIVDYGFALQALTGLIVGNAYFVSVDFTKVGGNAYISIASTSTGAGTIIAGPVLTASGTGVFTFVATAATLYLRLQVNTPVAGDVAQFANITCKQSGVNVALTQTGVDGLANSCSLLTAEAADATILQTITAAASAGCSGFYVKRSVGTGSIYITRDGGSNWTDVTSLINSTDFTLVKIENTSVTNPQVGFKIATSGDAIIVDFGINHLGTELANPILTTSAAVTVNADILTAPTESNFSDTAGTIVATVTRDTWSSGSVIGSTTRGLYTSASNSGVQGLDGTNTVNGPAGSTLTQRKIGIKYSGTSLQAFAGNNFGSIGSYDGSFNLTNISIASGARSGIKDIAIWQSSLTDSQITEINSNIAGLVSSHTISYSNIDNYTVTRDLVSMPNITSNIYNCQFRLGSVNISTSINYNNINSIIYAGSLNITPSINNYFNNCQYRPANADSSINTSYNLINCIINTGRLDSISNIDSSIYNCQYRLSNANIIATTTTNVLNNYKINTGFLITSNIVSSLVNKNIIYSIKLDAEYSVPVIQVNYLIN